MTRRTLRTTLMALAALSLAVPRLQAQQAQRAAQGAHFHVLQVFDPAARALPNVGFLTKALGDAGIASEYAGFAAGSVEEPGDLESMKAHARDVLHALDPGQVEEGPGFGFGLAPSVRQVLQHIEMAAASPDASETVRTHAEHVAACARNTLARVERMFELIEEIGAAERPEEASPLADELERLSGEVRNGRDENGDGRITWREGGLYQAQQHMEMLVRDEGLVESRGPGA